MKMLFVVPYPEHQAPSQRLKFEQYYQHFREAGITVEHRSFMSPAFWKIVYRKGHYVQKIFHTLAGYTRRFLDLLRLRRYDVVYVHLWVTPLGPPFFEWLYRKRARAMVYDIDDLVYLSEAKSRANRLIAALKGRKKPIYLMKVSDHVITCTPYLDSFVRKLNPRTTDISSTINTDLYRPRSDYQLKNGELVLGWSGSHSTSRYLHLLEPVLRRLQQEGIRFRLLVMGDPAFRMEGIPVEALPWKEDYEVEVIQRFDIGLYPLPDEQWVYGKSGLKALQYMAAGVPTIATAIGANFRIIEDGISGYLVKTEDEWYTRILALARDPSLRERIGRCATSVIEENYSVRSNQRKYFSILNGLIV
jgi:glycosyltransferase involved in cell wall biosynthesis